MSESLSTMKMRGLRVAAVLVASGIALAGCGSSSSGGSAAASNTPVASTSTTPASSTGTGGLLSGSFCTDAKAEGPQLAKEFGGFTGDAPAQLKAFVQHAEVALQAFTAIAPSAIKSDVAALVSTEQKIFAAYKKANYNYKNVSQKTVEAAIGAPGFAKAASDITAYLKNKCGITTPTG